MCDINKSLEEFIRRDYRILQAPIKWNFRQSFSENGTTVIYIYKTTELSTLLQVHKLLHKIQLQIPICCFTFEPAIDIERRLVLDTKSEKIMLPDFANGEERFPIPVISFESALMPSLPKATYSKRVIVSDSAKTKLNDWNALQKVTLTCCNCEDDCKNKLACPCFQKTLANCNKDWRLQNDDNMIGYRYQRVYQTLESGIYECTSACKCNRFTCFNRVTQNGMMYPVQLVHYGAKGWGVRAAVDVPRGSFICIYAGELITREYADRNFKESSRSIYLADLKCQSVDDGFQEDTNLFVLDGFHVANIGAFLNHSCSPNAFPQQVFWNIQDRRWPQVALFANQNIFAGQELTWDYGLEDDEDATLDKNKNKEEKIKCLCGCLGCRGYL